MVELHTQRWTGDLKAGLWNRFGFQMRGLFYDIDSMDYVTAIAAFKKMFNNIF